MSFWRRLFWPFSMNTTVNSYYISEQQADRWGATPVLVERLYATEELFGGGWTLYSQTDHPSRPVMVMGARVEDERWGLPQVEARHLSLSEVYNRMAAHEQEPHALYLRPGERRVIKGDDLGEEVFRDYLRHLGVREDGRASLRQEKPAETDPSYWRNYNLTPA